MASTLPGTVSASWGQRGEITGKGLDGGAKLFLAWTAEEPDHDSEHYGQTDSADKEEDRRNHFVSPGAGTPTSSISRASRPQLSPSAQTSRFQIGAVAFNRSMP